MNLCAAGAGYAMDRPASALLLEGRVILRMTVADEEDREGVENLMFLSSLTLGLAVDES